MILIQPERFFSLSSSLYIFHVLYEIFYEIFFLCIHAM